MAIGYRQEITALSKYESISEYVSRMCVTQNMSGLVECVRFPVFSGEVQNMDREVKKCLTEAFKKTDDEFLQLASACTPSWKDGSTAVAILVVNDVIYAAGIGDSKAVLCREGTDGELTPVLLTKDHSPVVVRVCVYVCVFVYVHVLVLFQLLCLYDHWCWVAPFL